MKRLVALILAAAIITVPCMAQEKLETDRPTDAQTPKVVGTRVLQVELGVKREQEDKDSWSAQHPNAVFRYGVAKWLELRLETNLETEHTGALREHGLKPVEAGLKARVYQTSDTAFVASLYSLVGLPGLASSAYQHNRYFSRFRFLLENNITDKMSLDYNIGRDWDDQQMHQKWMYAIAPQLEINEHWEVFGELYGRVAHRYEPECYVDGGAAYNVSSNLKLDLNLGKGLNTASADYFITAGVSLKLGGSRLP
jgi:hypothetical protein